MVKRGIQDESAPDSKSLPVPLKTQTSKAGIPILKSPASNLSKAKPCKIPKLVDLKHKGDAGRIGIVGGSVEYTGAPYFAGIASLRTGADLVHVFCYPMAAQAIKAYSPELIVHPVADDGKDHLNLISRLNALVIGPGLGRDKWARDIAMNMIQVAKSNQIPTIIDAVLNI